jgi:hypothetical protein
VDVRLVRRRNLEVVGSGRVRVARVAPSGRVDGGVRARDREHAAACEGAGVGLHLQVALVLEPVGDVDDEDREQDEHGNQQREPRKHRAALRAKR